SGDAGVRQGEAHAFPAGECNLSQGDCKASIRKVMDRIDKAIRDESADKLPVLAFQGEIDRRRVARFESLEHPTALPKMAAMGADENQIEASSAKCDGRHPCVVAQQPYAAYRRRRQDRAAAPHRLAFIIK